MKAMAFDGIARELGEASTRRSIFRLLGGAAAMGAGLAMTTGEQIRAKGKDRDKARSQGQVMAQGKKITICYQNKTRKVKKKGYKTKYPGATLGPCPKTQPVVCSSWILSGGASVSTPIVVDDDLQVMLNGLVIGDDNNDFIYIGADREFVATRDGTLFLGLNEGNLDDNSGSFKVKVEISPES